MKPPDWSPSLLEQWNERAAIMEEAGLDREAAEVAAVADVIAYNKALPPAKTKAKPKATGPWTTGVAKDCEVPE